MVSAAANAMDRLATEISTTPRQYDLANPTAATAAVDPLPGPLAVP